MVLPDRHRSRAVLIGNSVYQDERLPDLPSVTNNLADLRAVLADPRTGVFAAEHCTLVENASDGPQVATLLADIAATAEDVLLIYYAGHGIIGARQNELYFGLAMTGVDRPQYSALPIDWVRDELLNSRAATKILILDCCFSGRAIDDFLADGETLILGQVGVSGTYTLTASPANTPALALPGARYTAFSGELLALLRDGVPAGPAELNLHLLYRHLLDRMTEKGWPTPKQRGTDNVHDLALGRNPGHRRVVGTDPGASARLLQALLTDQVSEADLEHLFQHRIVVLNTAITRDVADRVMAQLLCLAEHDPAAGISLYINSQGGSLSSGMAIYDTMKFVEPDVATWAVGLVSGMAQILLSAGTPGKRYVLPHAKILLKGASAPDMHNDVLVKIPKLLVTIIAKETGQSVEQIKADYDQARWFSAQEALDYGLVDQLVATLSPPSVPTTLATERPLSG